MKKLIETKVKKEDRDSLTKLIDKDEVQAVLKSTKNRKCPSPSGITYEFWKRWITRKKKDTKEEEEKEKDEIDMVGILTKVYNDIEKHGITDKTSNKGIMYPLYKKKDRTRIENYRPLTMLETNYKIMTKILAKRLGKVSPKLIHKDQAGFIPGRNLYDHIKLSQLMPEYAEKEKQDGIIISPDQEKVYDKVDHDYMWEILEKFELP